MAHSQAQGHSAAQTTPSGEDGTSGDLVVATGVFDLLHIGHLRFLEAGPRAWQSPDRGRRE